MEYSSCKGKVKCPHCDCNNSVGHFYGNHQCTSCRRGFTYYANPFIDRYIIEKEYQVSTKHHQRKFLWYLSGGRCHYCRKNISYEQSSIDHVIPKDKNGVDSLVNCVIACCRCNNTKSNEDYDSFVNQKYRTLYMYPPVKQYIKYLVAKTITNSMLLVGNVYSKFHLIKG